MSKFGLLFLTTFAAGIIWSVFVNGAAAFHLYQLIYFLNPGDRWWGKGIPGISYSFVAAVLMLFALGRGYRQFSEVAPWKEQPVFKWIITVLIMYYIVSFYALSPEWHNRFMFDFIKLVVVVLVAYKLLHSKASLDASLWAYVIGATYIGYLAYVTGRTGGARVEGIGTVDSPDANGIAAAIAPALVILMYFAWMGNWKLKILCAVCGAMIVNGLVLINSRGSFLAVLAGGGLYLLSMMFSRYRKSGQRAMAIFIAVAGIAGAFSLTDDLFWQRMNTMQDLESKESGAGRVQFWLVTFDMLESYPMGMGVHGYNLLAPYYMDAETRGGVEHRSVHSMWFQGLSELGWIGFGFFLMVLFSLFRMSRKTKRWLIEHEENSDYFKLLALECALLSYLVAGSFINQFRAEILYWLILFLAVASNVHYLQPQRAKARHSEVKSIEKSGY